MDTIDVSEWHLVFFDCNWNEIPELTQTVFGWSNVMRIMMQWRHCDQHHRGVTHFYGTEHTCLKNVYAVDIANTFDPRKDGVG